MGRLCLAAASSVFLLVPPTLCADILWIRQELKSPYEGQYTGITAADLNQDGYPDLLVSAGKHWIDQSYVLMNLGPNYSAYGARFSPPLPLGEPSGHYSVQAERFASFGGDSHNEWGVLLSGADCSNPESNQFGTCTPGTASPAVLLRVSVRGCRNSPCVLDWSVAWQDAAPAGDRNGALAFGLSSHGAQDDGDPAIVLVGNGGATIFEPPYGTTPTWQITPEQQIPFEQDPITRGTGLAVGSIGEGFTGFFVGTRTLLAAPPAPIVAVWKRGPASYAWYNLGNDNNAYYGNVASTSVQATGLVLADLNGDGILDLIEANHLDEIQRVDGIPIQQDY